MASVVIPVPQHRSTTAEFSERSDAATTSRLVSRYMGKVRANSAYRRAVSSSSQDVVSCVAGLGGDPTGRFHDRSTLYGPAVAQRAVTESFANQANYIIDLVGWVHQDVAAINIGFGEGAVHFAGLR